MYELKLIEKNGIQRALEKAEKYRLLNDPLPAESICKDILEVDPENRDASILLLLSLTDQFGKSGIRSAVQQAQEVANNFADEYSREYYSGIISERRGTAALNSGNHGSEFDAYEWYVEAMEFYEKAEKVQPEGYNDPKLRWNTCARMINTYNLKPRPRDDFHPMLE